MSISSLILLPMIRFCFCKIMWQTNFPVCVTSTGFLILILIFFHSVFMGVNTAVGQCSCHLKPHYAKGFCPIAARGTLLWPYLPTCWSLNYAGRVNTVGMRATSRQGFRGAPLSLDSSTILTYKNQCENLKLAEKQWIFELWLCLTYE